MADATKPAGADSAPAGGTRAKATEGKAERRPKPSDAVLTEARKLGKVIVHPKAKDVTDNPGARGYDEHGRLRPADARAVYLVVPKPIKPSDDPTPEDHARAMRKAGREIREARRKAAEKAEG